MTRKDYVLIAAVLRKSLEVDFMTLPDFEWQCDLFADALASDNPRFNRATFLAACGV